MAKRRVLTFTETVPKRRFKFLPLGEFGRSLLPEAILIAQADIIQYPQEPITQIIYLSGFNPTYDSK